MTHRYPTRYRTNMTETRAETLPETRTEKEEKKQKRLEKEQKRLEKEAKKKRKEEKRMEKEAAETLAQMSTSGEKKKSKKNKEPKIYPEDTIEAAETYCDACWREGEVVSVPNCREKCCTMNVCAYGCTFTCFMCEDSWRGTWKDRNDWFWAGYEDETFPVCPTCMPMVAGMPVSRSAAGLFPWTGLWPGVWLGCPTNC